jgi:Co/Zn/Cd efflux system component
MIDKLDLLIKLICIVSSIACAVYAMLGHDPIESLLFAILFYMWGRDG